MRTLSLPILLLTTINLFGQLPDEKPIYPNGIKDNPITHPYEEMHVDSLVFPNSATGLNRVYSYVSEPTYMLFPANKENNKNIGLVIFPGGGLRNVWLDKEGTDIALWLSEQGINCMVVKYRTNRRNNRGKFEIDMDVYKPAVDQDARASMIIMNNLADSLGFDKDKIGVMGFSAGGWIAERVVYKFYNEKKEWNPNFVALIYHGSRKNRITKVKDPKNLPPFFLAISRNDYRLGVRKVMPYLSRVVLDVPKSELHVYRDGGHGFGLGFVESTSVSSWKNAFLNWVDSLY